jgi:hypothetical protein
MFDSKVVDSVLCRATAKLKQENSKTTFPEQKTTSVFGSWVLGGGQVIGDGLCVPGTALVDQANNDDDNILEDEESEQRKEILNHCDHLLPEEEAVAQ